jgi:hypothetical protein
MTCFECKTGPCPPPAGSTVFAHNGEAALEYRLCPIYVENRSVIFFDIFFRGEDQTVRYLTKIKKGFITMALEITPWRRFGSIRPFRREMEDLWDRFFRDMPLSERTWEWAPSVDISEYPNPRRANKRK